MRVTVPHNFYVYTLSYPDGQIFYVGKGKKVAFYSMDRINDHEKEARSRGRKARINDRKIAAIWEIWECGKRVIKKKVAFFLDEAEAYMYEWALINMTCYADQLTNIANGPSVPVHKRILIPLLSKPICIVRGRGQPHHQIVDLGAFCNKTGVNRKKMLEVMEEKIRSYNGWRLIVNCPCLANADNVAKDES